MAKVEKISFHQSGICRHAFTKEYGTPESLADRALHKWKRPTTSGFDEERSKLVASIAFPTNYLSRVNAPPANVRMIRAAPEGDCTLIEIFYTRETESSVTEVFGRSGSRKMILYSELPTSEAIVVAYNYVEWNNREFKSSRPGTATDLVFSPNDPYNTGKRIRIRIVSQPKDGGVLYIRELGGYPVPRTPNTYEAF